MSNIFAKVDPDGSSGKAFTKLEKNVQKALSDMFVDMTTDTAEKLGTIKAAGMLKKLNTTNEGGVNYKAKVQKKNLHITVEFLCSRYLSSRVGQVLSCRP